MIAFTAESLYTPTSRIPDALLLIEDGLILKADRRDAVTLPSNVKVIDFPGCIIAPGFIDIHIHGSAGFDVMQADQTSRAGFERFLARHGVTSYCPTTVSAPIDVLCTALERLADRTESKQRNQGAKPIGIHLEGPFLSHACRGVHPPENLLLPTLNTFDKLWQAARRNIRVMTIAPELDGAAEVIAEATKRGVCVSLGHSDANLEAARRGVTAGARHATHTFNAMRRLDHRDPGILAEVLTNDRLTADVIADGFHVAPAIVDLLAKAKSIEKLVLITDAISAAGMPDGRYRLGSFEAELQEGKCLVDGRLAGSALTMDRAVRNFMSFAKVDLQGAITAAAANPARVVNQNRKGTLDVGMEADFVVLTRGGEVQATVIQGVITDRD